MMKIHKLLFISAALFVLAPIVAAVYVDWNDGVWRRGHEAVEFGNSIVYNEPQDAANKVTMHNYLFSITIFGTVVLLSCANLALTALIGGLVLRRFDTLDTHVSP